MALADHLAPGTKETLRRTGTDVDGAAGLEDMQLLDRLQHDIGDLAYAIATVRPDAADVQVREIVKGSALLRRDTHFRRGGMIVYLDEEARHQLLRLVTGQGSGGDLFLVERRQMLVKNGRGSWHPNHSAP